MNIALIESLVRWSGGLLAYTTLGAVFYGIWRGTQRQAGRITGQMGGYLRSPWFYLVTSAIFFGISFLGWVPLPLSIPPPAHAWMLLLGALLYFPGIGLALWGRLALGKNYFVSTGFSAQLFTGHRLITGGPFAFVRHPMYAGLILAALGSLMIYHTWTTLLFACFAPALFFRARREETALAAEFGVQWQKYCQRVPAFLPRPGKKH
ncbi:MAG: isoprenylcysteine carboxylmethyltransferase family protein [Anaerolineales bacterium]|jgi:protein-S-isoprenylcysteine O-methyltransferase Ste14|nr:isoprenylcysteine carboxylmethyltransferase family protein [Anaerolineales bacterium]